MDKQYFKRNELRQMEQITQEEALTLDTYGIKDEKSGHIFKHHTRCDEPACNICNLSVCMVCGAYEGGLTTECCGRTLSMEEIDEVYEGKKDFRYGRWIEGVTTASMLRDAEGYMKNMKLIFEEFKDEIVNKTELGNRVIEQETSRLHNWTCEV